MIRSVIAFLVVVAFVSSTSAQPAPQPTPPAKKSTAKPAPSRASAASKPESGPCIGVIPAIGDGFGVQRVGISVFGNEYTEIPVSSWGLEDLVVARVRAAAPRGFVVKRIPFPKSAFDAYYGPSGDFFEPRPALVDIVRRVASSAGCERYVVVTKWGSRFGTTNQSVLGIGMVHIKALFHSTTLLFAITKAIVYDRNFATLKQAVVDIDDKTFAHRFIMLTGPSRELPESRWPDRPAAADTPMNRDAARGLLTEGLDRTLPALLAQ